MLIVLMVAQGTVLIKLMMKWCGNGRCGAFGQAGGFIIFSIKDGQDDFEFFELFPMALLGNLIYKCNTVLDHWRDQS